VSENTLDRLDLTIRLLELCRSLYTSGAALEASNDQTITTEILQVAQEINDKYGDKINPLPPNTSINIDGDL
jgi:hypothetical protein